jgi:hypothetical protein
MTLEVHSPISQTEIEINIIKDKVLWCRKGKKEVGRMELRPLPKGIFLFKGIYYL